MSIGSMDTVKNANPLPTNPGTVSPKQVKEFNEAVNRSTTSSDSSQHSQDTSKSHPILLAANKPPTLTCASPTAQQKAGAFVDPALRDVASGKTELAKNAKGPAVAKMQEALQTAGYKLPRFGADGKFGDETAKALKKFQKDHCLKDSGRLDKQTMEQLSIASTKYPEYDKLFADGKLNTTIAVGYDEDRSDKDETKDVISGLTKRGYTQLDPDKVASDKSMEAQFKAAGIDPKDAKTDNVQYFTKSFKHNGKDVTSVVKLITADTPAAKDKFAKSMGRAEQRQDRSAEDGDDQGLPAHDVRRMHHVPLRGRPAPCPRQGQQEPRPRRVDRPAALEHRKRRRAADAGRRHQGREHQRNQGCARGHQQGAGQKNGDVEGRRLQRQLNPSHGEGRSINKIKARGPRRQEGKMNPWKLDGFDDN
jgi:peptidoglycan hydrolase-like protein with peptidoglycan-binding domain